MLIVEFAIALIASVMAYFGYTTGMLLMMVPCIVVAIGAFFVFLVNLYFSFSNKRKQSES